MKKIQNNYFQFILNTYQKIFNIGGRLTSFSVKIKKKNQTTSIFSALGNENRDIRKNYTCATLGRELNRFV